MNDASIAIDWAEPDVAVAGHLTPQQVASLAAQGFRTVICNRPDEEAEPGRALFAQIQAACAQHGLQVHYLPVAPSNHTDAQARQMAELVDQAVKPVLAYCRTGRRSRALLAQGRSLPR